MSSKTLFLKCFFNDPNKKGYFKILKELLVYGWIKKVWPIDYFRKFLYRKSIVNYKEYLSLKEYYSIIDSHKIVVRDAIAILENKLSFSLFTESLQIPSPKTLSHNFGAHFYYNSKPYYIGSNKTLIDFFKMVFKDTNQAAMFIKPISGVGGKDCMLLHRNQLEAQIEQYAPKILNSNYIHQENIQQHVDVNKIFNKSINTLRIHTFLNKQGQAHVISGFMRFGTGQLVTDNVSSGGFFIALNLENESLKGSGQQSITLGGTTFTHHPDSNIKLDGFKIPFLKEALAISCNAATKIPTRIVGWDIAITNQGPIIIEGNHNPCLHTAGLAYGGLSKNPIIQTILKEIKG